jgi:hypothetical protein
VGDVPDFKVTLFRISRSFHHAPRGRRALVRARPVRRRSVVGALRARRVTGRERLHPEVGSNPMATVFRGELTRSEARDSLRGAHLSIDGALPLLDQARRDELFCSRAFRRSARGARS